MKFLHELEDAHELFKIVADEIGVKDPYLVEKDYWIMHALWGLQQQGFNFELKGGTSLSKGFKIINRFSEDIDIHIYPESKYQLTTKTKKSDKKYTVLRESFFNDLCNHISVPNMQSERDQSFDDKLFRSAGIRLNYKTLFDANKDIKQGVLLEVGFDNVAPNTPIDISSWAYQKAKNVVSDLIDNRAKAVKCYLPEYTFVEKLQTISTKVRLQRDQGEFSQNFLRHFYDIHQLYQQERVKKFIGTQDYINHKNLRFRQDDERNLKDNIAFNLDLNPQLFDLYLNKFSQNSALYFNGAPTFKEIYNSIVQIREVG